MFSFFKRLSGTDASNSTPEATFPPSSHESSRSLEQPAPVKLLVIQEDNYHWAAIFSGRTLPSGRPITVVQTSWKDLHVGPVSNTIARRRPDPSEPAAVPPSRERGERKERAGKLQRPRHRPRWREGTTIRAAMG